jgi:hypothetical protein
MELKIKQKRAVKSKPAHTGRQKPQDVVVKENPKHREDFEQLFSDAILRSGSAAKVR